MKQWTILAIVAAVVCLAAAVTCWAARPKRETRAMWIWGSVIRDIGPEKVAADFEKHNLNTAIMLVKGEAGSASWDSKYALVKNLSNVGVFDEKDLAMLQCNVTELAQAAGDVMKSQFEANGRTLTIVADEPVTITGDSEAMNDLITELLNNALRFSVSKAELFVGRKDGHSVIIASNDTTLPDGNVDQVFDRFARLDNAEGIPGAGLGLSHVKEIVQAHNARASAQVVNGEFILRINL